MTTNAAGLLTVNQFVMPPLNAGDYVLRLCNQGPDTVTVSNFALLTVDPNPVPHGHLQIHQRGSHSG